jgi:Stress responsive A/B Barrel Domain
MRKRTACAVVGAVLVSLLLSYQTFVRETSVVAADSAEPKLAHMVFFTLKDRTPEGQKKLTALCQQYLTDHPGTIYFSAGARADEYQREVNDRDFDVALHVVFKNKQAHDDYQVAPRHLSFIEEGKPLWAKVRVFDSYVN